MEEERVGVQLPDLEETQIWDADTDEREVALYLQTKSRKVSGEQFTPFILPQRWTFDTLRDCVHDYVSRVMADGDDQKVEIKKLYFKKKGNSKTLVALQSDHDIPAMLQEYPLTWPGSGKKRKATIIMAADWSYKTDEIDSLDTTPRRSPRVAARRRERETEAFVFQLARGKNNDAKLSNTSVVLHGLVYGQLTLDGLKDMLKTMDSSSSTVFVPSNGLCWIRKGSKQLVALNTDVDLRCCFEEYTDAKGHTKAIRIACAAVSTAGPDISTATNNSSNRKRALDFTSEVEFVQQPSKVKKDNDLWNNIHCSLVRDLEKKGTLNRYGVKHLKVWTDEIFDGKSSGIGEEPIWQNFIEQVGVPPKPPRLSPQTNATPSATHMTTDELLKAMFIQNQQRMDIESKRAEVFQNSMMAIMAANSPMLQQQLSRSCLTSTPNSCDQAYKKPLLHYTQDDCCTLLRKSNLSHLESHFLRAEVDGSLLVCLRNPHISDSILEGLSIHGEDDKEAVIHAVKGGMPVSASGVLNTSFT